MTTVIPGTYLAYVETDGEDDGLPWSDGNRKILTAEPNQGPTTDVECYVFETYQYPLATQFATDYDGEIYTYVSPGDSLQRGSHFVNRFLYVVLLPDSPWREPDGSWPYFINIEDMYTESKEEYD